MKRCLTSLIREMQIKKRRITSVGKDMEKRNKILCHISGMWIDIGITENSMGVSQKVKNGTTVSGNYPSTTYSKKIKTLLWEDICISMFIIAFFTICKIWKLPEFPLMDECIKKVRYICLFYMFVRCTYIYICTYMYIYTHTHIHTCLLQKHGWNLRALCKAK